MIDTIVIRLHDLKEHSSLASGLQRLQGDGMQELSVSMSGLEFRMVEPYKMSEYVQSKILKAREYNDTQTVKLDKTRQKLYVPSSIYYVRYFIDSTLGTDGYIEFEFSVPKYLYGNNIAQFGYSWYTREFKMFQAVELNFQLANTHKQLMYFIKYFFKKEFLDEHINYRKLEIRRFDLAFNQYFNNCDDAINYLEILRRKKMKGTRTNSQSHYNYETAITVKTDYYYAKIYHKGAEFMKNDKSELIKKNEIIEEKIRSLKKQANSDGHNMFVNDKIDKLRKKLIDIKFLEEQAQRILRYEMEFTTKGMSYFYNQRIWRKTDSAWKQDREIYNRVEAQIRKNVVPVREEKIIHRMVANILSRTKQFYYETSDGIKFHEKSSAAGKPVKEATFSEELFRECTKKFRAFIDDFQTKELPLFDQVVLAVEEHNQRVDKRKEWFGSSTLTMHYTDKRQKNGVKKIDVGKILKLTELLNKYSFDELVKFGYYSRRTIYRLKDDLKAIGVDPRANMTKALNIETRVDFAEYYKVNTGIMKIFFNNYDNAKMF